MTSMIRGLGFTPDEMPSVPTTLHDFLVGLVCFAKIYTPLETLPKLVYLLGDTLMDVLRDNALEFIWWDAEEGIALEGDNNLTGGLSSFVIQNPRGAALTLPEKIAITGLAFTSRAQARTYIAFIAKATNRMREGMGSQLCASIEASLSLPHVRRLLGMSMFTPPKCVPRWLAHPVLRAARLARAAETCQLLRACSIKFPFGATALANALFATEKQNQESAASTASYVL